MNIKIDPNHNKIDLFESNITQSIWKDKYRYQNEQSIRDSFRRVVSAVCGHKPESFQDLVHEAMCLGLWNPAGRIHAGAGTGHKVTLMNCYVMKNIPDSMKGIADVLKDSMLTMQQGGGIGLNFSTLRPSGAHIENTGAMASGPLPFMDMWSSMCSTIMSAGNRRGAMMATMFDTHPDLLQFVHAKKEKGRLTNFNVSVLISDAFMDAVRNDANWDLFFPVKMHGGSNSISKKPQKYFVDDEGTIQYIYSTHSATDLWDEIIKTTYDYSEPGTIFIDRVNNLNNLQQIEVLNATNPCGEEPLPQNGLCCLGSINLARMVNYPFSDKAEFDFELLSEITALGVEFLDLVIDVTEYPLEEQKQEELSKRRIGLGITGLADAMAMLGLTYGESQSETFTRGVMRHLAIEAYKESNRLAITKGAFPLCKKANLSIAPFIQKLPSELQTQIKKHGLRNGVLLTVAPTGTTSIYYGNCSSGLEPVFTHKHFRKVLQSDDSYKQFEIMGYGAKLYQAMYGDVELPKQMVTTEDLDVEDHIRIQAAAQEWVDASISKTVNCDTEISFEKFKEVYNLAYIRGCKGCTTYRPNVNRGSILSTTDDNITPPLLERPTTLEGVTYKVRWPSQAAIYVTINHHPITKQPFEVFFSCKSSVNQEWMTALSLVLSSLMRLGIDHTFIIEELMEIASAHDSNWVGPKHFLSLPAYLGKILFDHFQHLSVSATVLEGTTTALYCPSCSSIMMLSEGCSKCTSCLYTKCG